MKIAFFLMSQKGYAVLQSFVQRFGTEPLDIVVTARDPAVEHDYADEIEQFCGVHNIRCAYRESSWQLNADYAFAISWRWIEDTNPCMLIVLHDSLLPRYRGFAPLVSALINGDKTVGVTALIANDCYDAGDVILQKETGIEYPAKIGDVITLITPLYCELVTEVGAQLLEGRDLVASPMDEDQASYSLWRDEKDYAIDWTKDAAFIRRFVDAVGPPYKGASSFLNGRKVRVLEAKEVIDVKIENRSPGKVIFLNDGIPTIVCGSGLLRITSIRDDESGEDVIPMRKFRSRFEEDPK